jgi:hypothetical protein
VAGRAGVVGSNPRHRKAATFRVSRAVRSTGASANARTLKIPACPPIEPWRGYHRNSPWEMARRGLGAAAQLWVISGRSLCIQQHCGKKKVEFISVAPWKNLGNHTHTHIRVSRSAWPLGWMRTSPTELRPFTHARHNFNTVLLDEVRPEWIGWEKRSTENLGRNLLHTWCRDSSSPSPRNISSLRRRFIFFANPPTYRTSRLPHTCRATTNFRPHSRHLRSTGVLLSAYFAVVPRRAHSRLLG